jgi:ATPase subunit of ABC transporter with duplicated ATPase domains
MQGLMSFRSELEKAFATALKILEVEDPDTAAACVEVRNKGRKVILSFSGVLLTLSLTPTLLEGFEKGAANGDHSAAVGRLDSAKTWLRKLRGEISTLTSDYIELGDHVFYLAQCVDAVCDVAVSAASTSPRESWRKARQLALQEALDQLQTAARMLHEPWDCFSSMFEVAQNLVVACQRAQSLRDSLIMGSPAGRPDLARMYAEFCDSLRDMSDSM